MPFIISQISFIKCQTPVLMKPERGKMSSCVCLICVSWQCTNVLKSACREASWLHNPCFFHTPLLPPALLLIQFWNYVFFWLIDRTHLVKSLEGFAGFKLQFSSSLPINRLGGVEKCWIPIIFGFFLYVISFYGTRKESVPMREN